MITYADVLIAFAVIAVFVLIGLPLLKSFFRSRGSTEETKARKAPKGPAPVHMEIVDPGHARNVSAPNGRRLMESRPVRTIAQEVGVELDADSKWVPVDEDINPTHVDMSDPKYDDPEALLKDFGYLPHRFGR